MYRISQAKRKVKKAGEPLYQSLRMNNSPEDAAKLLFRRGELILMVAGPGCMAANSMLHLRHNGENVCESIEWAFNNFTKDCGMTVEFMPSTGALGSTKIVDVWKSGMKETFTVTTEYGATVRATAIHPFRTKHGWKELKDLEPGDKVWVDHFLAPMTKLVKIESITPYGMEMTYDLEVEDDEHNFIANGFVVHNTGKSFLVQSILQKGDGQNTNKGIYFSADSTPATMFNRAVAIDKAWKGSEIAQLAESNPDYLEAVANTATPNMFFDFRSQLTAQHVAEQVLAYAEINGEYPEFIVIDNLKNLMGEGGDEAEHKVGEEVLEFLHEIAGICNCAVIVTHHAGGLYENNDQPIPLGGVRNKTSKTPEVVATLVRSSDHELYVSIVKDRNGVAKSDGMLQGLVECDYGRGQFS